jgi:hypothetical protein
MGTARPAGVSIGRFLRYEHYAAVNADFVAAVSAIDRVHGVDEHLPEIAMTNAGRVTDTERQGADAWFRFDTATGQRVLPIAIAVRLGVPHRRLKTLHEIGHFLDLAGLPGDGFSSWFAAELDDWRDAVGRSRALRDLAELSRSMHGTHRQLQEALALDEVWARSYAQFVAARCGDPTLLAEVDALRLGKVGEVYYPLHWTADDFASIAAAIVALFRSLSWMS